MGMVIKQTGNGVDVVIVAPPSRFRDGLMVIVQGLSWVKRVGVVAEWTLVFDYMHQYQPAIVIFDVADLAFVGQQDMKRLCLTCKDTQSIVIIDRAQQREVVEAVGANAMLLRGFTTELLYQTMRSLVVAYDPAVPVTGPLRLPH